jgi:hypothetical protein
VSRNAEDRLARFKADFVEVINHHPWVPQAQKRIAIEMAACIGLKPFKLGIARCWRTARELAARFGTTTRTVRRCRVTLQKIGAGEISRNSGGKGQGPVFDFSPAWPGRMLAEMKKGPFDGHFLAKPGKFVRVSKRNAQFTGTSARNPAKPNADQTRTIRGPNADKLSDSLTLHKTKKTKKTKKTRERGSRERANAPALELPLPLDLPSVQPTKQRGNNHAQTTERGTRLAKDWQLSAEDRAFAADLGLDADRVADSFRDYWTAAAGPKARKCDWTATWRNWCRREAESGPRGQGRGSGGGRPGSVVQAGADVIAFIRRHRP